MSLPSNDPLAQALISQEARLGSKLNRQAYVRDLMNLLESNVAAVLDARENIEFHCRGVLEFKWDASPSTFFGSIVLSIDDFWVDDKGYRQELPQAARKMIEITPFRRGWAFLMANALAEKRILRNGPGPSMGEAWRSVARAIASTDAAICLGSGRLPDMTPLAQRRAEKPTPSLARMSAQDMAIFEEERRRATRLLCGKTGPEHLILRMVETFRARINHAEASQTLSFTQIEVSESVFVDGPSCPIMFMSRSAVGIHGQTVPGALSLRVSILPFGSGMGALIARARLALLGQDAFIERLWAKAAREIAAADARMRSGTMLPAPPGLRALIEQDSLLKSCEEPDAKPGPSRSRHL